MPSAVRPDPQLRIVAGDVTLRPLLEEDAGVVAGIGGHPSVSRWWPGITEAELVEKALGRDDVIPFVIEVNRDIVGLIQAWEENDPEYRHAGIDIFLGASAQGRGVGPRAVRALARWLIGVRGHHRLVIDPRADNARAIAAYRKVGFRPVGVLRRYQRMPDGSWHDGLLMDVLAEELGETEPGSSARTHVDR